MIIERSEFFRIAAPKILLPRCTSAAVNGTMSCSITSSRRLMRATVSMECSCGRSCPTPGRRRLADGVRGVEMELLEVVADPAAVHDQEVGFRLERGQHAVPGIHRQVDALAGCGTEGPRRLRRAVVVEGDDHQERTRRQRIERL